MKTLEELYQVPCINTVSASPNLSAKYTFIPTNEIINVLDGEGWEVRESRIRKSRTGNQAFAKHMLRFKQKGRAIGEEHSPEIVLVNSHDGTSSYQLHTGIFRLVCSNGLIIGRDFGSIRIPHRNFSFQDIRGASQKVLQNIKQVVEKIDVWNKVELSEDQQNSFVSEAIQLRFPENQNPDQDMINSFNAPYRSVDAGPNLWRVFNRVQEKLMGGGMKNTESNRRIRKITGIEATVKLNTGLWDLANKYSGVTPG